MIGIWVSLLIAAAPATARAEAPQAKALAFEDLPALIAARNGAVRSAESVVHSAESRSGHLLRSYLPDLEAVVGAENFQTGFYKTLAQPYGFIEARVNLFRGGRDLLESSGIEAQVALSAAQSKGAFREQLTEARKVYWTLVYQREIVGILNDALVQSEKSLASANLRIQRGLTTETDRLDFEIHQSQIREEIESFEHEALLTEAKMQALLAFPEGTGFATAAAIPHIHDDSLLAAKVDGRSHPEVLGLVANREIVGLESRVLNRWWTPSLDAYAGYYLYTLRDRDYLGQSLRDDRVAGVRLSLPLFDGLRSRTQARSASLRAQALDQQAEHQARWIQTRVRIAQEEMKHDHELIHNAEDRLKQVGRYLSQTQSEYDRGVKNSPDVLNAIQRQIGFKRRHAELRRDYQISKSELLGLLEQ